jgi:MoaA/NifB/PqqE/SkfB family radical SAM enzyme
MANISLTSACVRHCDYCFARGAVPTPSTYMSVDTFEDTLALLERSAVEEARLLGGEPTLHPQFVELVDRALERGFRITVFSSGIMPERVLERLQAIPPERLLVLVNVTPSRSDPEDYPIKLERTLARLGPRAQVGLTVASVATLSGLPEKRRWVEDYGLVRRIRIGLAQPVANGENCWLKPRAYAPAGQRIALFAESVAREGLRLELDCGCVPCMFPPDLLPALRAPDLGRRCGAIPDILPDGSAVACYPLAGLARTPRDGIADLELLRRELNGRLRPYRAAGVFRDCARCPLRAQGLCHGGCLGAALHRFRSVPGEDIPARTPARVSLADCRGPGDRAHRSPHGTQRWALPYTDQPLEFWQRLKHELGAVVSEVCFPLSPTVIASGRPPQPARHLDAFLRAGLLPGAALVNPVQLPAEPAEVAPRVIAELRRLQEQYGVARATVASRELAQRLRDALPALSLTASCLMDVAHPNQVAGLDGLFDGLVPASRIMRRRPALRALRQAFPGRIRLIVNEACLPECPFREQHFRAMASGAPNPPSLCDGLLRAEPWRRLTGAWVLPQHLHLFDGVYDELKLAGRVTLRDPEQYLRVLRAYIFRWPLGPSGIGGGPASMLADIPVDEDFYRQSLDCTGDCGGCRLCPDYFDRFFASPSPQAPRVAP